MPRKQKNEPGDPSSKDRQDARKVRENAKIAEEFGNKKIAEQLRQIADRKDPKGK